LAAIDWSSLLAVGFTMSIVVAGFDGEVLSGAKLSILIASARIRCNWTNIETG
jgi:hypothetical protein